MTNFVLIDRTGRAYMTGLDRKALGAMTAVRAVEAHTAKKQYRITPSDKYAEILADLNARRDDARRLHFEREDARKMAEKMEQARREGRELHALEIYAGGRLEGRQYFMQ